MESQTQLRTGNLKKTNRQIKLDSEITSNNNIKSSSESLTNQLLQTNLAQFCSRKLFYIFFVHGTTQNSMSLLESLNQCSKYFGKLSSLTFITRSDVLGLIESNEGLPFPSHLQPVLHNVIECIKNDVSISTEKEAQLLKLKLIQIMYEQYANDVKKQQKERSLNDLLNTLSKECKKKKKVDSPDLPKSPKVEDVKKKGKKDTKDEKEDDIDYLTIPLEKNDIEFDENIFDNIWFYCISGFREADIFQYLIQDLNVPVTGIIRLLDKENEETPSDKDKIEEQFTGNTNPYQYLEDTVLMKFMPEKENEYEIFQDFLFAIRRIVDLKLTHLKYIRSLYIHTIKNRYKILPLDCMKQYNKFLKYIPVECIDQYVVFDSLLKEIDYHLDETLNYTSTSSISSKYSTRSLQTIHCINPIQGMEAFNSHSHSNSDSDTKSILIHENNDLLKTLKSYRPFGVVVYNTVMNFLMKGNIISKLINSEANIDDIVHTHDRDPSNTTKILNQGVIDHFMYLFLFNIISNKRPFNCNLYKHDLTRNLETFDWEKFIYSQKPTLTEPCESTLSNLYETSLVDFLWKEYLDKDVMLQQLFKASEEFSSMEQAFSPETDTLLVLFSDKLDEFGLSTIVYQSTVRTPICLRDFCRYITIGEHEWLKKNATSTTDEVGIKEKMSLKENCPGVFKVKTEMKIFQEYLYLLHENDIEIETTDKTIENNIPPNTPTVDFYENLINLQEYPSSKHLKRECAKMLNSDQLITYDLSSNLLKLTGHVTTFSSHDGVKVTVDNTKFLQSPEKCSIKLASDGNILLLYASEELTKNPYVVNLCLENNTRISFVIENVNKIEKIETENKIDTRISESNSDISENILEHDYENAVDPQVVYCIEENALQNDEAIENLSINDDIEDLLEAIEISQERNGKIYKINQETKYLKRLIPSIKVPIDYVLQGVLSEHNITFQNQEKKKSYPKICKSDVDFANIKVDLDFRICLPNGLFVRSYPDPVDTKNIIIKQEYAYGKPQIKILEHEEFRIFTPQGFILIKKVDGTITILRSNGDIINFEKLIGEPVDEGDNLKQCRCATIEDYMNKVAKILRDEETSNYSTSRRAHITTRQNRILDQRLLALLQNFDVPYLKKTIIKFDGKRIKIQGNKITEKQLYYLTSQQNFFTEEIEFERNDNFKGILTKDGTQMCLFPDDSLITISVDFADELVEDYVFVTVSYQYKHPHYVDVCYDFDETACVTLANNTSLKKKKDEDDFTVEMLKNNSVTISKEHVKFVKSCSSCLEKCVCIFNVKPFYKSYWKSNEQFFHLYDSYNKSLHVDYVGNCSRNGNFITGQSNRMQCNHYRDKTYKKLFVVKKNLSGEMFLTNQEVNNYVDQTTETGSVIKYNMISDPDIEVTDCRKYINKNYSDRFFDSSFLSHFIFEKPHEKQTVYSTFRVFHKMFDSIQEIKDHLLNVRQIYFSEEIDSSIVLNNISNFIDQIIEYEELHKEDIYDTKKRKALELERAKLSQCACTKEYLTIKEKLNKWKEHCDKFKNILKKKDVPIYFQSEFCRIQETQHQSK